MGKHTLDIENDYDFLLIGISSHEKDYRICWALNKKLGLDLVKIDSLEIKGKKQKTTSFFSHFLFENKEEFIEYSIVANLSENKAIETINISLFSKSEKTKHNKSANEILIPEFKKFDYFFVIRGEIAELEINSILRRINEMELVQTAVQLDVTTLKSKQNLIF